MHHANFVHLHVHTYYSLLDGACPIEALAKKAKEYRMPALAMTDHGNLFATVEFYQTMQKAGIKPIIGCEVYLPTRGGRKDRTTMGEGFLSHLTLLAKNRTGYQNLCKLSTLSYIEGFYYKPRIDKDLLRDHSEGLVALSGCLKGEVSSLFTEGRDADAEAAAEELARIFPDRFYLELMNHGIPAQDVARAKLIDLGQRKGWPCVATHDVHYLERKSAPAQDALLCIQTGKVIQDEKRLKMATDRFYFTSPDEMIELFRECPDAVGNTVSLASQLNLELDFHTYHFPKFTTPHGEDLSTYLDHLSREGLAERLLLIATQTGKTVEVLRPAYEARLASELKTIREMGFSGYFLIVADFIHYARGVGMPVGPGRGSAAGSLVAYCLRITDIDPLVHDLLFERFLNPERISMPDMDIDFCMRRRDEVIRYVAQKYGSVSQIITFGKMKARAVVRDVGRVMGLPYGEVDRIAKLIPATLGMTLEQALEIEPRLMELAREKPQIKELIDIARQLEGFPRHASTHAAGVVISDRPLTEYLPLCTGQQDEVITQFDMKAVEKTGLIKFDFLGLKTLTVIDDAVRLIEKRSGTTLAIDTIPLDDARVYQKLSEGDTQGIFQLESQGMTALVQKLKPTVFSDIVALVALFRPGPLGSGMVDDFINRKHGRIAIHYELPQLEPILRDTYGVIVYQEQVMRIASELAGFNLGDADILRRAMGKKQREEMTLQRERFLKGAATKKIPPKKAERIFDLMAKFAEYGFNKCVVAQTELIDATTGEIFTVADVAEQGCGRMTFSCDERCRLVKRKIVSVMSNGRKKVFSLETHLGHRILATKNHPFLTFQGWKPLRELKKGDRLAVPRSLPVAGKKEWPQHEVITLAWLLSEGNTCHPHSLYFYNNDKKLIDDFVSHIERFPHTKARAYQRRSASWEVCVNTGTRSHLPWNAKKRNIRLDACPRRSGAFSWADRLGLLGKKATEKSIPPDIFKLTNEQIALFLGRLWSGDGFIFAEKNTIPYYATSSLPLSRQVQHLLLRLGILSRIAQKSFRYQQQRKRGYAVYLTGENSAELFMEKLGPWILGRKKQLQSLGNYLRQRESHQVSRDTIPASVKWLVRDEKMSSGQTWKDIECATGLSMKEFYGSEHIWKRGFRRDTILQLGRHFYSDSLLHLGHSDIYWDEIKEITEEGIQETFDLTVEGNHNFVANGIIVHNSHSAAYALVAYQTAYLKCHHPTEYLAALITAEHTNADKVLEAIADAKNHGITVLPPDVNESDSDFSVVGEDMIRFGLGAVKNVGEAAIESMLGARKACPFASLGDFCERIDSRKVNKRVLESLIKCGAFDSLREPRARLMAALDHVMEMASHTQRDRQVGQSRLFDLVPETNGTRGLPKAMADVPEWPERQLLSFEKEALGFYITGHPLAQFEQLLKTYATVDTVSLADVRDRQEVRFGGVVAKLREVTTRRGDRMGFVTIEDLKGMTEVVVFSDVYTKEIMNLKGDRPVFVVGLADTDGETVKVIAQQILPLEDVPLHLTKSVHFVLHSPELTPHHLEQLKSVLTRYPGNCPGFVHLVVPEKAETVLELPQTLHLEPSPQLVGAVQKLFGHNVTHFSTT